MTARLGKKLGKLRTEKKLSPETVGEKLGVHPIYLKRWELAKEWPDPSTLAKLADIYEVPLEELTSIIDRDTAFDTSPMGKIPIATITLAVYFVLVYSTGYWHPTWVILGVIPLYRKVCDWLISRGKFAGKN